MSAKIIEIWDKLWDKRWKIRKRVYLAECSAEDLQDRMTELEACQKEFFDKLFDLNPEISETEQYILRIDEDNTRIQTYLEQKFHVSNIIRSAQSTATGILLEKLEHAKKHSRKQIEKLRDDNEKLRQSLDEYVGLKRGKAGARRKRVGSGLRARTKASLAACNTLPGAYE
jgi:DNA repair ATPase RecN